MPRNKNTGNSTTPKPYASRGSNTSKGGVLSKESASYIEKMVGRETKRKKKKEQKKTEDGIVKRLAKNGLIDKDKVGSLLKKKSSTKKKKKKKGSSSSSSYSDSSSGSDSDSDSSSESSSSSSDYKKKKSTKKKKKKSSDDKPSGTAKSKSQKKSKVQKLAIGLEAAQKGMIEMATELRELRGLPAAIQKTFDAQISNAKGTDPAPEPLLTMSQWKELQETNKKERSLPPTPIKPGLFTEVCEKMRIVTPLQLLQDSPHQASTTTSVSTDRAGVLAAVEQSLTNADNATKLSLSSGFTVPVEAERVLKHAALTCATKYFEDDPKESIAHLTALLQKFGINTSAKKSNTMLAEMLRACVTRGINVSSEELGI